ncbi:MAG: hypothetical protein WB810_14085 [Candidatus Cybelea sp.]
METVVIAIERRRFEFTLHHDTRKWTAAEPSTYRLLSEGEFPLIADAAGKRYELYSDKTFAEVEL